MYLFPTKKKKKNTDFLLFLTKFLYIFAYLYYKFLFIHHLIVMIRSACRVKVRSLIRFPYDKNFKYQAWVALARCGPNLRRGRDFVAVIKI